MPKRQERSGQKSDVLNLDAAGIDIGAEEIYVSVPLDRDEKPVHKFSSLNCDLRALGEWLEHCRIRTVAMESTGAAQAITATAIRWLVSCITSCSRKSPTLEHSSIFPGFPTHSKYCCTRHVGISSLGARLARLCAQSGGRAVRNVRDLHHAIDQPATWHDRPSYERDSARFEKKPTATN